MKVAVVTTGTLKTCKAPLRSPPPTYHHSVNLQAGCPSCHPTNCVKMSKHWRQEQRNL